MAETATDKAGDSGGDEEDQFFAAYQQRKEEANRRFAAETQALEAAERGLTDASQSAPAVRSIPDETLTLPLTSAMRNIIGRRARMYAIWGAVATIAYSLFLLVLHAKVESTATPGVEPAPAWFWPCMALIVAILPITFGWKVFRVTTDLRSARFLRSQGRMSVNQRTLPGQSGTNRLYTLKVGDASFFVQPTVAQAAAGIAYGSVDYSQRAHEVFEIHDADGATRYRMPRYFPDA